MGRSSIIVSDCSTLPGKVPTRANLKRAGWEPITKRQVGLAEMAHVDLKLCHGTHWAPKWFKTLLEEAPRFASQHDVTVARWLGALVREGVTDAVGLLLTKNEVDGDDVAFCIPRLLSKPVAFGDVRIDPEGRAYIKVANRKKFGPFWREVDEAYCLALDAQARLTGVEPPYYEAAQILLGAYEKARDGKARKTA